MQTSFDLLLHWMSHRGQVTNEALGKACLHLSERDDFDKSSLSKYRYYYSNALHRLGHIETSSSKKWQATPPCMLWNKSVGRGVFYGARTPRLRLKVAERFGAAFLTELQPNCCETWLVECSESEAEENCTMLGIQFMEERGAEFLASLPSIQKVLAQLDSTDTVPDLERESWEQLVPQSNSGWAWRKPKGVLTRGVFRVANKAGASWRYLSPCNKKPTMLSSHSIRGVDEVGRCARWRELVVHKRPTLWYCRSSKELTLPVVSRVPLPIVVDRALCMASGKRPVRTPEGRDCYSEISIDRARSVGRILGMKLEASL